MKQTASALLNNIEMSGMFLSLIHAIIPVRKACLLNVFSLLSLFSVKTSEEDFGEIIKRRGLLFFWTGQRNQETIESRVF